jgi:histone H3/H4
MTLQRSRPTNSMSDVLKSLPSNRQMGDSRKTDTEFGTKNNRRSLGSTSDFSLNNRKNDLFDKEVNDINNQKLDDTQTDETAEQNSSHLQRQNDERLPSNSYTEEIKPYSDEDESFEELNDKYKEMDLSNKSDKPQKRQSSLEDFNKRRDESVGRGEMTKNNDRYESHRASSRKLSRYDSEEEYVPRKSREYKPRETERHNDRRSMTNGRNSDDHFTRQLRNRDNYDSDDSTSKYVSSDKPRANSRHERHDRYRDTENTRYKFREEPRRTEHRPQYNDMYQRDMTRRDDVPRRSRKSLYYSDEDSPRQASVSNNQQSGMNSEDLDISSFNSLPKTAITKMAKSVGITSLQIDIYSACKQLAGTFVNNVIENAAENSRDNIITSTELEPVVEQYLRADVIDLRHSNVNVTTFAKYCKTVSDLYRTSLKKEAVLYLHNSTENYILNLFSNALSIAKHARRTRVSASDLQIASRM